MSAISESDSFLRVADFYSPRADYPLRRLQPGAPVVVGSDVRSSGEACPLWMAVFDDACLVSTRHELVGQVGDIIHAAGAPSEFLEEKVRGRLLDLCSRTLRRECSTYAGVKLFCAEDTYVRVDAPSVRKLTRADLSPVMAAFYPDVRPDDPEYAEEILGGHAAFACYLRGEPVALAHTHHPGYMCDSIGDLSVEGVLPPYRRCGYGKAVVSATTGEVLRQQRTPVWGAFDDNTAARETARSVGYRVFCRVLEIR